MFRCLHDYEKYDKLQEYLVSGKPLRKLYTLSISDNKISARNTIARKSTLQTCCLLLVDVRQYEKTEKLTRICLAKHCRSDLISEP